LFGTTLIRNDENEVNGWREITIASSVVFGKKQQNSSDIVYNMQDRSWNPGNLFIQFEKVKLNKKEQ
jgi:hypothetical protein